MKRVLLAALIMLGTGITPGCGVTLTAKTTAEDFPVPPIPPEHPPVAETAPVPNADARAPIAPQSASPTVDLRLYRARPYDPGLGFAPGSRYQTSEDRKPIQTPGLSINVPLQ
jgi:hypothetical protein